MDSSEVTIQSADVDVDVDTLMTDEASKVDWHQVKEEEAASFGLALALYRDVYHSHLLRRNAWGTATGGVISASVLSLVAWLCGASGWFALAIVIGTQLIRALWLYRKAYVAAQIVGQFEQQAVDVLRELAQLHPAKG
jgi:hypothetical protein